MIRAVFRALGAVAGSTAAVLAAAPTTAETVQLADTRIADLPGFASDDLRAAFGVFRASCAAPAPLRPALPVPPAFAATCAAVSALPANLDAVAARAFFETHFVARRVGAPNAAFFTGYYEPVVDGSLTKTAAFATPLYSPPPGLVGAAPGTPFPGLDPALTAARKRPDGTIEPMPDRAAIETGALTVPPLLYLHSPVDAFFVQVQGSARIKLADGSLRRLAYAGRNGYPYTSIGRLLVERLKIPPAEMGMTQLRAWIHANGEGPTEAGGRLMQANRSYIFFRFDDGLPQTAGPIGGEGVSLTPLRSLAIDRAAWSYGLPFYVDATMPWRSATPTPFQRVLVGQDTGAAIVGPARGDIFFGTGDDAATRAGPIRAHGTLFVLWPRDRATSETKP